MASKRFRQLERRLKALRKFLPPDFEPTGDYPESQADMTRAYRMLSHAEIESCIEDIALDTVTLACKRWEDSRRFSRPLLSLVAYCGDAPIKMKDAEVTTVRTTREVSDAIAAAKKRYSNTKSRNNGIRAYNVRELLLPAGIGEHELDATWLTTIDSFAAKRGETAHLPATVTAPDPKNEFDTVTTIVEGLGRIDAILGRLRR